MGIVNARPDSFSDAGGYADLDARVALALRAARRRRGPHRRRRRVGRHAAPTGRRAGGDRARRAARASGSPASSARSSRSTRTSRSSRGRGRRRRRDRQRRQRPARPGARRRLRADRRRARAHAHARAPRSSACRTRAYDDVVGDVVGFLARAHRGRARARRARRAADPRSRPGLRQDARADGRGAAPLERLHALGRPLLLAVSRKYFVGAITGRAPRERLAGTLAAVGHGADAGAHDPARARRRAAADFLAVRAALRGETEVDPQLALDDTIRHAR